MSKDFRMKLEKLFDFLGEIIAFVVAVVWALVIINANFPFLPGVVATVFAVAKEWLLLVFVAVVGLEATIKRNFLIRLFFYLILAVLIIFHCFHGVYDTIIEGISSLGGNASAVIALL